jgi:hypothetical protein
MSVEGGFDDHGRELRGPFTMACFQASSEDHGQLGPLRIPA